MRVVHVIDTLAEHAGGPAQACIDMAEAVAARGHSVAIYALGGHRPAWLVDAGSPPVSVRHRGVDVYLLRGRSDIVFGFSPGLYAALARAIPAADVVHAHVLNGFHLWAAWRVCRRYGVPLIVRPCGILNDYVSSGQVLLGRVAAWAFQGRLLRDATLMHYTTTQEAHDAGPYVRNPRRVVVPLGLDLGRYERVPPRDAFDAQYPEARGRQVILYFGRLHRKKRLDLVFGAAAAALRRGHDVHVMLAGPDDGMEAECRTSVRDLGLADRTTFTGLLVGEAKRLVFAGADVFVLPSMTENFGIAVVEAAAFGVPLLISEHVNVGPFFACDDAALVVAAELEAVTSGLEALLVDRARARAMAVRARRVVERSFTWDAVATDLLAMYYLLGRPERSVRASPPMEAEMAGGAYELEAP